MAIAAELRTYLVDLMSKANLWTEKLLAEIPNKWERHGDCILFPSKSFSSIDLWSRNPEVFDSVARILKVKKLARKYGTIQNDGFRRPKVELIYGKDPWIFKKENGIDYAWNITKCMFSSGNITEKQRIASWDCRGQVIVDLYSGIGYFTLTYLVHSKAELVYACEWNPDAIQTLEYNLKLNGVQNKCIILSGDNKQTCPRGVANQVNLGLIPSSEASWYVACGALKRKSGGILHIHGNVDTFKSKEEKVCDCVNNCSNIMCYLDSKAIPSTWVKWSEYVLQSIQDNLVSLYPDEFWGVSISNIVKIKSYGPNVDHLVVDIICIPKSNNDAI